MSVIDLIAQLQACDIKLHLDDEKLKISAPPNTPMDDWLQKIKAAKSEIIAFLKQARQQNQYNEKIVPIGRQSPLPLSFSQQRLWFIDQLQHDASYNMAGAFEIKGRLDLAALEQAFSAIITRQEQLRVRFVAVAGEPVVEIDNTSTWHLPCVHLADRELPAALEHFRQRPFDLAQGPLFRAELYQLAEQHWVLALAMHHIISDAWSLQVFTRELETFYHAALSGQQTDSALPPLQLHYIDYAAWQREKIQGDYLDTLLAFWKKQLSDCPVLELPLDRPREAEQVRTAARHSFVLSRELGAQLKALSRQQQVTLFTLLLSAYKVLLYRLSGSDDFCVGVPSSHRHQAQLENLIGFFINSLPLRDPLGTVTTFSALLQRVNKTRLEAEQYQELPFEQLLEHLGVARDLAHPPIFQTMFSLEHRQKNLSLTLEGAKTHFSALENDAAKFDLTLTFFEEDDLLCGEFEYNSCLFEATSIESFARYFEQILQDVCAQPDKALDAIKVLSVADQQTLLNFGTGPLLPLPQGLINRFEHEVKSSPERIALEIGAHQYSYRDVQQRTNKLANYLTANGLKKGQCVAIFCERSYDWIVSILAVVKAGGVYLPIETRVPEARLRLMLDDASPRFMLSQENAVANYPSLSQAKLSFGIICVDRDWRRIATHSGEFAAATYEAQRPLYIIYTSGSTGVPKGVVVPEQGLCNLLAWHQHNFFEPAAVIRMGQVAGAAFDAAAWEIWTTLCAGGTLVLAPEDARISAAETVHWIAASSLTHVFLPTPLAEAVFSEPLPRNWSLRYLFTGGDQLTQYPPRERSFKLINAYGPTECSVVATAGEVTHPTSDKGLPSIGRPISNVKLYILNSALQLVPPGVMGELYIGGAGLAQAYLNKTELTAEKFIPDPFAAGHLYRSGDLARWLPTGDIAYCGRIDQQVQIRGFRVELGDIESALTSVEGVKEAVVIASPLADNTKRLLAYLVLNPRQGDTFDKSALEEAMKKRLPDYMQPADYVVIEALPLTANGKIDVKRLPRVELSCSDTALTPPGTNTEREVLAIWQQVLKSTHFGVLHNFFQIGGHSLLATQVMARLRDHFKKELPLRLIFDHATVSALATHIDRQQASQRVALPALKPVSRTQHLPLTFSQERLWVLDRLETGAEKYNSARAYNISSAFDLRGQLNLDALKFAFTQLVARHEVLRTTFNSRGEQIEQCILPPYAWFFMIEDVRHASPSVQENTVDLIRHQESTRAFDLEEGERARRTRLIRTRLLQRADDHYVLFITLHHIIADGWSVDIICKELSYFYQQYLSVGTQGPPLPALPVHYADYAVWQRTVLQQDYLTPHIEYWRQQLAGIEALELTLDFPRPPRQSFSGAAITIDLPQMLYRPLAEWAQSQGMTPFVLLMAAYKILLSTYTGQSDLCVGTPIAQRPVAETEQLIGFFVNTLALRSTIDADASYLSCARNEQATLLAAFEHQDVPFEKVVDALALPRDLSRSPVFQTLFSFQKSDLSSQLSLTGLTAEQLPQKNTAAQFELSLAITDSPQVTQARFDYNSDLFKAESIQQFAHHYVVLLQQILAQPEQPLHTLNLLSPAQYQQQVFDWNATTKTYPPVKALHHLFETQVITSPNAVALVFEGQTLTYAELNQRANQRAHHLIACGATRNQPIAVCMQRSFELVISLYAILKAGAAYLPLDVSSPADRLQAVIDDAGVSILLTENHTTVPNLSATHRLCFADMHSALGTVSAQNPKVATQPDDIAYVIYTSGSTGKPKGVAVPHAGVINRLLWMQDAYPLNVNDVVLQKTPYSFDVSVWEFFWPLFTGARLVIAKPEGHKDPDYLCQLIQAQRVTTLHFVPSMLGLFLLNKKASECRTISTLFCSGEALKPEHCKQFFATLPEARLVNLYGPTEASIDVSVWECHPDDTHPRVPIGKPIANTQLYVLDKHLKPVPQGVPGELYIAGVGLALGYLGQPALTAERFIPHFLSQYATQKMYKTGDRVRYLADGNIDYLGRFDFQIKLRGLRIELGEIENQLDRLPRVKESVVVLSKQHEDAYLVAYVATDDADFNADEVKKILRSILPDYMIPSALIALPELPLSPNGKLDRKALPAWTPERKESSVFVAPRNDTETHIAQWWCELLHLDAVGVTDNFFELGGHSLLATRLVSRIRDFFSVEVPLSQLFEQPTVEALANSILALEMEQLDDDTLALLLNELS